MAGQLWITDYPEGYAYSPNLSKTLRTALQPTTRFRQFCDVQDPEHQVLHRGDMFHWDVYLDVEMAGGKLAENAPIPETSFQKKQGTLRITEYGNSVPYSGKLDNLSEKPVKNIIKKVLVNDAKKVLDKAAADQFALTPLRVAPTDGTATDSVVLEDEGATTITNNVSLGTKHVKKIVDLMKERNIPTFTDDDYYCIAWPSTLRPFKDELEAIKSYTETGYGHIMRGEIGRYENCRFVEQSNVKKTEVSTAKSAWTNGKSNWAVFFGADTVAEAMAIPEEIRGKLPGDYGRDKGVAWYFLGGYGIMHDDSAQARIIIWDSAA